jgi:hypothetical protein
MKKDVVERLYQLGTSHVIGNDIKEALNEICRLETKNKACQIVLSALSVKAKISNTKLISMLEETEKMINNPPADLKNSQAGSQAETS